MANVITDAVAIGIDLGDQSARYACVDNLGTVTEEGSVKMTPDAFRKTFGLFAATRIAIEAGAQSHWAAEVLGELGHEVIIANPRRVRLISASRNKSDRNDAVLLARFVRIDPRVLFPLKHRSRRDQETLLTLRARDQLVKTRTALTHSVRGLLKVFGIRLPASTGASYSERCRKAIPAELLPHLDGLLAVIDRVTAEIEAYDERVQILADSHYPQTFGLRTVYGVGTLTALAFTVTIGDPARFRRSRDLGSYLGLKPSRQQSGDADPQLGITKEGDGYLRRLLVQCAHCILSPRAPDSALRQWALRLCERGGKNARKRAVVAVARKLAVLLHRLLRTGETYKPFPAV